MPVYRLLAAFTPTVKFTQMSSAVKEAAGFALRGGGSLLALEDRGVRRSWDRMKGKRVAEAYDQVRFVNLTAYMQLSALEKVERTLRSDPEVLRVRLPDGTALVASAVEPMKLVVDPGEGAATSLMSASLRPSSATEAATSSRRTVSEEATPKPAPMTSDAPKSTTKVRAANATCARPGSALATLNESSVRVRAPQTQMSQAQISAAAAPQAGRWPVC